MSGYQFSRIQTYSLKGNSANRSALSVLSENSRVAGSANHVKNPIPPRLLFGIDPIEIAPIIDKRITEAKAGLRGTGQRIQSNTHVLEGAVYSHPLTVEDLLRSKSDCTSYLSWRKDAIAFAIADAKRRGLEVLSVVEHLDEPHPHIHILSIPFLNDSNKRLDAKICHPGHVANKEAAQAGKNPKEQMQAYRDAMKRWQDRVWESVSVKHGLTRIGPRLKRLTQREYTEQKNIAQIIAKTHKHLEVLQKETSELTDLKSLLNENRQLKTDLKDLQRIHSDFKQQAMETIGHIKDQSDRAITELQDELARYKNNSNAFLPRP